jgi:HEPN domain-containing protein
MNVPDKALMKKVQQWTSYGNADLRLANHGFTLGENAPFHLIAYHAQQSVEKYLKAYLVFYGVEFPYTHNLLWLLDICPDKDLWSEKMSSIQKLIPFSVSTRYPGIDEEVTEKEAREAVEIAVNATQIIRNALLMKGVDFTEDISKL